MNAKSITTTIGLIGFLMSSAAWSIPVSTVGATDQLIAQTNLGNSGDATELGWVASVLNMNIDGLVYEEKTSVGAVDWAAVDGNPGVWAFELSGPTDWFLIKTGNIGGGQTNRDFLFANIGSLDYAVVALADMGITQITNVGKISHVGEFNGTQTSVPEPATLSLFGLGVLGMGLAARRRRAS
jgi:hypothetical protein